jgi:hypothetical protein
VKVKNKTQYESAAMLKILRRAAKEELEPAHRKRMVVHIRESNRGITHRNRLGSAFIGGDFIEIVMPKNPKIRGWWKSNGVRCHQSCLDPVVFAKVAAHEFAHARGLDHKDMHSSPRYRWVGNWRDLYAWANEFPIRVKPKRKRPKPGNPEKLANIKVLIQKWESKKRRAENALKKYRQKARYYERRLAADTKEGGSDGKV